MSHRPWHKATLALGLFSWAFMGGSLCLGQEKPAKAPEPAKENGTSIPAARPQQNGLRNLEEDLFKPLKTFAPNSSLDGVFSVPPRPAPQRPQEEKKVKEKRDREKNWVFMSPEELMAAPTVAEIFNVEGAEKAAKSEKKKSAFEQYYRRSFHLEEDDFQANPKDEQKKRGSNSRRTAAFGEAPADEEDEDNSGLSPGLRESQRTLKSLAGGDRSKEKTMIQGNSLFTDIFGLTKNLPTAAEVEAKRVEKARMDQFKQILGMPPVPPSADSLNPLAGLGVPYNPVVAQVGGLASEPSLSKATGPGAQLGAIPAFSSAFSQPANERSESSSFLNPAPVLESPKPHQAPVAPSFAAPRRPF
jgi:hypothetical protein